VRSKAEESGTGATQGDLQDLGQRLVAQDPLEFTRAFLRGSAWKPGESVVVDGLRHVEVFRSLKTLTAPSDVSLLFLEVEEGVRLDRFLGRFGGLPDQFYETERHPVEKQVVRLLKTKANLVLDGTRPVSELVALTQTYLRKRESNSRGSPARV